MFFLSFTMHVLWLVDNMLCDCGSDALKYLVKCPRKSKLFTGVLRKVRLWEVLHLLFITRDDVVSQRLKFGSAFLSSSWESKIALFF